MAENGTKTGKSDIRKGSEALVLALARGLSVRKAAEESGIAERTIWRRLKDPAFQAKISEARMATMRRTVGILTTVSAEAVKTLRGLMKSAASDAAKVNACR